MLKLVFCLHRLPHLSREAFQTYWREHHAPLVAKHAQTLGIVRYVQVHALTDDMNAAIQRTRGGPDMYDGIAEICFENWDSFFAAGENDGAKAASAALLADEKTFIDLSRSPLWFNHERVIIG